jgi:hypothetical protein
LENNTEGYKKRDSAFSNEIPTWVVERSEISNLLKEDLSDIKSLIDEHIMISKK